MSFIPIEQIRELRNKTGSSLQLCQRALEHENHNFEAAEEYLRVLNFENDLAIEAKNQKRIKKSNALKEKERLRLLPFYKRLLMYRYYFAKPVEQEKVVITLHNSLRLIKDLWSELIIVFIITLAVDVVAAGDYLKGKLDAYTLFFTLALSVYFIYRVAKWGKKTGEIAQSEGMDLSQEKAFLLTELPFSLFVFFGAVTSTIYVCRWLLSIPSWSAVIIIFLAISVILQIKRK